MSPIHFFQKPTLQKPFSSFLIQGNHIQHVDITVRRRQYHSSQDNSSWNRLRWWRGRSERSVIAFSPTPSTPWYSFLSSLSLPPSLSLLLPLSLPIQWKDSVVHINGAHREPAYRRAVVPSYMSPPIPPRHS